MTQTTTDYSHRSPVEKLGITTGQRVEVVGDVGVDLRRELREVLDRGFVRSAELDAAIRPGGVARGRPRGHGRLPALGCVRPATCGW